MTNELSGNYNTNSQKDNLNTISRDLLNTFEKGDKRRWADKIIDLLWAVADKRDAILSLPATIDLLEDQIRIAIVNGDYSTLGNHLQQIIQKSILSSVRKTQRQQCSISSGNIAALLNRGEIIKDSVFKK